MSFWSWNQLWRVDTSIVSVAAVYWADHAISETGGIYTRWVPDLESSRVREELRTAIRQIYVDAAWAYIVTWDKMKPSGFQSYADEVNSVIYCN